VLSTAASAAWAPTPWRSAKATRRGSAARCCTSPNRIRCAARACTSA